MVDFKRALLEKRKRDSIIKDLSCKYSVNKTNLSELINMLRRNTNYNDLELYNWIERKLASKEINNDNIKDLILKYEKLYIKINNSYR